jgi:hypothetical protein
MLATVLMQFFGRAATPWPAVFSARPTGYNGDGVKLRKSDVHGQIRHHSSISMTFCALVREDHKADLIDGIIYLASPDNTDANRLNGGSIRY